MKEDNSRKIIQTDQEIIRTDGKITEKWTNK